MKKPVILITLLFAWAALCVTCLPDRLVEVVTPTDAEANTMIQVIGGSAAGGSTCTSNQVIVGDNVSATVNIYGFNAVTMIVIGPYAATEDCDLDDICLSYTGSFESGEYATLGIYTESTGTYTKVADTPSVEGDGTDGVVCYALDAPTALTTSTNYYFGIAAASGSGGYIYYNATPQGGDSITVTVATTSEAGAVSGTLPATLSSVVSQDSSCNFTSYGEAEE